MDKYNDTVRNRTMGRSEVRSFSNGQTVLVINHVGKPKWLPGKIIRKVCDKSYIVLLRGRYVKRHIDDLIPNNSVNGVEINDDGLWMYSNIDENAEDDQSVGPRFPTLRRQPQPRKEYPRRMRQPVDRYGISMQA